MDLTSTDLSKSSLPGLKRTFSRIGFGCWQLGGPLNMNGRPSGWGEIEEETAMEAIIHALENGINFFDTSVSYGNGRSEEILGDAFSQTEIKPVLCTKFGHVMDAKGNTSIDFSKDNLLRSMEGSLERTGLSKIDVLLLHNPPTDWNWAEIDPTPYRELVKGGTIGCFGVSCKNLPQAQDVMRAKFGSVVEAVYNPLDRRAESRVFPLLQAKGFGFIARVPLASGFLSPKAIYGERTFQADDIRATMDEDQHQWMSVRAQDLSFLDDEPGGITTSALRFQLSREEVNVAIPGMYTVEHVESALQALDCGALEKDLIKKMEQAVPSTFHKWL